jgi:phosphatidylglycerol---prolipoprotein diacylglyceryl transferase
MHSTLIEILGVPIRSYGLMMVIGFALGLWRMVRVGRRRGIPADRIYDLALVLLLSGIIGARIVYVVLNPDTESWRELIAVWNGGLSFHGGVLFAVLAGYVYIRRTKLPFWGCADLAAPSLALAYSIARIGCFLNGCCYGAPTDLPWGVRFCEGGVLTPPSHPTQLYAALASLLIFFVLTRIERLGRAPGFVFVSYLGLYGVYRFLIEFLRKGYSAKVFVLGLTEAQVVSLLMLLAAAIVLATVFRRPDADKHR